MLIYPTRCFKFNLGPGYILEPMGSEYYRQPEVDKTSFFSQSKFSKKSGNVIHGKLLGLPKIRGDIIPYSGIIGYDGDHAGEEYLAMRNMSQGCDEYWLQPYDTIILERGHLYYDYDILISNNYKDWFYAIIRFRRAHGYSKINEQQVDTSLFYPWVANPVRYDVVKKIFDNTANANERFEYDVLPLQTGASFQSWVDAIRSEVSRFSLLHICDFKGGNPYCRSEFNRYTVGDYWSRSYFINMEYSKYYLPEDLRPDTWRFDEDRRFYWAGYTPEPTYLIQWLEQSVTADACLSMPRLNDNMLSNIADFVKIFISLFAGKGLKAPKSIMDVWLGYRYSYGTTKMDVEDCISYLERKAAILDSSIKTHSIKSRDGVTMACTATFKPRVTTGLQGLVIKLREYGLTIDPYVIWDIIPFSFMVDWAIPIGDTLSAMIAERNCKEAYDLVECCYSISYSAENTIGISCLYYERWCRNSLYVLYPTYFLDEPDTVGNTTVIKRLLDSVSIIFG